MSNVTIKIDGIDKLERKLGSVLADCVINRALKAATLHVKGKVAKYPPQPQPSNPRRWYERGYGSRWRRADGSIGGKRTSETLGKRWTIKIERHVGIVGNNVSYARYVQDKKKQARVHRKTGWVTIQDVAKDERQRVIEFFRSEIIKAWRSGA